MAMEKCEDCGNQVSSRADECPHCGRMLVVGRMHEFIGVQGLPIVLVVYFFLTRFG